MKKSSITVAFLVAAIVLAMGYLLNYHWLLKPKGAIMAATDVSYSNAGYFGEERLWKGITPGIGIFFLENIVNLNSEELDEQVSLLSFCLNQYYKEYEVSDPERVERIYSVAQYLIDSGVSVNERPKKGFTAVEGSIIAADYRMFSFLVQNGANLKENMTIKGKEGLSLADFANELKDKTKDSHRKSELNKIIQFIETQNITRHFHLDSALNAPRSEMQRYIQYRH